MIDPIVADVADLPLRIQEYSTGGFHLYAERNGVEVFVVFTPDKLLKITIDEATTLRSLVEVRGTTWTTVFTGHLKVYDGSVDHIPVAQAPANDKVVSLFGRRVRFN